MSRHQITRVRHELRRRRLTVQAIERLTPSTLRISFTSPDLHDFVSASPDDHIKLMFSPPPAEGERPVMRDFTPRKFDTAKGTIAIDFVLHDAGPATQWAASARIGDTLEIGGPRGSAVVPDDFDWYLLIGDETAFPAIGRRVEELRPGVPVITVALVNGAEEAQDLQTQAQWKPHWIVRQAGIDDAAVLKTALDAIALPKGEGFVWIAAESGLARSMRTYLVEDRGHPREWVKAAGYWTRGSADSHERIED